MIKKYFLNFSIFIYTVCFFEMYSFQKEHFQEFKASYKVNNHSDTFTKKHSHESPDIRQLDGSSQIDEFKDKKYFDENNAQDQDDVQQKNDNSIDREESYIREELSKLPEDRRPIMRLALNNMKDGKLVFDSVQEGQFFDAIKDDLWINSDSSFAHQYYQHLDISMKILNSSDKIFWDIIQKDSKNKEKFLSDMTKKLDIDPDLLELLSTSPEYTMYFRLEYLRLSLNSLPNKDLFLKMLEEAYLRSIAKMQWYFYKKSILQGKIFTSGMITFKDKNQNCFKFLEGYVHLVSDGYRTKGFLSSIAQTKAYLRISSHYKGQTALDGKQYGIDLNEKVKQQVGLPVNKSHILFGIRDNGMTFIKWEDYGTTFNPLEKDYSAIPHTFSFLHKHGKANGKLEYRESGSLELKNDFEKIYGQGLSEKNKDLVKVYGIAGMHTILEKLPDLTQEEKEIKKKKLQEFHEAFLKYFSHNDLSSIPHRKGLEVILNFDSNK